MSALNRIIPHDHVTEYAAGTLSDAKSLMINCQRDLSPRAAREIESQETIAAGFMLTAQQETGSALSDGFMAKALASLPPQLAASKAGKQNAPSGNVKPNTPANDLLPDSLSTFMDGKLVEWSFFAPGMQSMSLWQGGNGEHLWLLKVKGGKNMPEHSHAGEEWSLILKGSYHVGTTQFTRGDLHVEDEHCTHLPMIDPGVDCICLILTEGPLQPTGLVPKLLMPFARI